jgi:MbtH protein
MDAQRNGFEIPDCEETIMGETDTTISYKVLVNHEEQYSIWPAPRANPDGWRDAGMSGAKDACLAWVDENWTDMRPLSLRRAMAGTAGSS